MASNRPKSVGRSPGVTNYSKEKVDALLEIVESKLPVNADDWELACKEYNHETGDDRDPESIRRKFRDMANTKKSASTSIDPGQVELARAIYMKIREKYSLLSSLENGGLKDNCSETDRDLLLLPQDTDSTQNAEDASSATGSIAVPTGCSSSDIHSLQQSIDKSIDGSNRAKRFKGLPRMDTSSTMTTNGFMQQLSDQMMVMFTMMQQQAQQQQQQFMTMMQQQNLLLAAVLSETKKRKEHPDEGDVDEMQQQDTVGTVNATATGTAAETLHTTVSLSGDGTSTQPLPSSLSLLLSGLNSTARDTTTTTTSSSSSSSLLLASTETVAVRGDRNNHNSNSNGHIIHSHTVEQHQL